MNISVPFSESALLDFTTATGGAFRVSSIEESYAFCKQLARAHYENFPVGSLLIPAELQPHFFSVYAFSRIADDIADELAPSAQTSKHEALAALEHFLCSPEHINGHPVFMALHETMRVKQIPALPFQKLLTAFRMDSDFRQPRTMADIEHYCTYSANPVGELVLRIFDLWNSTRAPLSDAVCTGLQCANFWQDIAVDIAKGRVFLPEDLLRECALDAADITSLAAEQARNSTVLPTKLFSEQFLTCMNVLFLQTKSYFDKGKYLLPTVSHRRLRAELALTIVGGERILEKTRQLGVKVLHKRTTLSKRDAASILVRAVRLFLQH